MKGKIKVNREFASLATDAVTLDCEVSEDGTQDNVETLLKVKIN